MELPKHEGLNKFPKGSIYKEGNPTLIGTYHYICKKCKEQIFLFSIKIKQKIIVKT